MRRHQRYKKTQIKLLEMKITMCEMKNTLDGIKDRLDIANKKISAFKDTAIGTA